MDFYSKNVIEFLIICLLLLVCQNICTVLGPGTQCQAVVAVGRRSDVGQQPAHAEPPPTSRGRRSHGRPGGRVRRERQQPPPHAASCRGLVFGHLVFHVLTGGGPRGHDAQARLG